MASRRKASARQHHEEMMAKFRMPRLDRDRYTQLKGMEGPFQFKGGEILYYDPREGKYYDRDADMYLSDRDADRITSRTARHKLAGSGLKAVQALLPGTSDKEANNFLHALSALVVDGDVLKMDLKKVKGEIEVEVSSGYHPSSPSHPGNDFIEGTTGLLVKMAVEVELDDLERLADMNLADMYLDDDPRSVRNLCDAITKNINGNILRNMNDDQLNLAFGDVQHEVEYDIPEYHNLTHIEVLEHEYEVRGLEIKGDRHIIAHVLVEVEYGIFVEVDQDAIDRDRYASVSNRGLFRSSSDRFADDDFFDEVFGQKSWLEKGMDAIKGLGKGKGDGGPDSSTIIRMGQELKELALTNLTNVVDQDELKKLFDEKVTVFDAGTRRDFISAVQQDPNSPAEPIVMSRIPSKEDYEEMWGNLVMENINHNLNYALHPTRRSRVPQDIAEYLREAQETADGLKEEFIAECESFIQSEARKVISALEGEREEIIQRQKDHQQKMKEIKERRKLKEESGEVVTPTKPTVNTTRVWKNFLKTQESKRSDFRDFARDFERVLREMGEVAFSEVNPKKKFNENHHFNNADVSDADPVIRALKDYNSANIMDKGVVLSGRRYTMYFTDPS